MLDTRDFGEELKRYGFRLYSGVPCSFLKDLINFAVNHCDYIAAANEGDAVAICAGAYLGGTKAVLMMQNSGLTNATSPLTSLNYIFKIPVLGFVSWRGEPGLADEPQHELMGQITTGFLDLMRIEWEFLSSDRDEARKQLARANRSVDNKQSFFFVVKMDTFSEERLLNNKTSARSECAATHANTAPYSMSRADVLKTIIRYTTPDTVLLATTGYTGRELYQIGDQANNFYMVGSMGCVSSLALGLACTRPDKKVVAIDGDGAILMRLGALAANAGCRPPNMLHILLDNRMHESTGSQGTVSGNVNWPGLAAAAGYPHAMEIDNIEAFEQALAKWRVEAGLTFMHIGIKPGALDKLGRPAIKPHEVKDRLMQFIGTSPVQD